MITLVVDYTKNGDASRKLHRISKKTSDWQASLAEIKRYLKSKDFFFEGYSFK